VKRIIRTAALLLVLLLCGCSALREDSARYSLPQPEGSFFSQEQEESWHAVLYFPQRGENRLLTEMRQMPLGSRQAEAEAVVSALLDGPHTSALSRLGAGLSLEELELSQEVANVYLRVPVGMGDEARFTLASAVTNTLCQNFSIRYVNVFFSGQTLQIEGRSVGTFTVSSGEVHRDFLELQAAFAEEDAEINATLYFVDESRGLLLPEVRRILLPKGGELPALLNELALGPTRKTQLKSPLSGEFLSEQVSAKENIYTFAGQPFFAADENAQQLAMAALYYTLCGALPQGGPLTFVLPQGERTMTHARASACLGQSIRLYFPQIDLSTLTPVEHTVAAAQADTAMIRLQELIAGPAAGDSQRAWTAFPEGVTIDDLYSADLNGRTIILDFSENFRQKLCDLSEQKQVLLIYSIVNTLTEPEHVSSVRFLVEGQIPGQIGERLSLIAPLLPNPGLIEA